MHALIYCKFANFFATRNIEVVPVPVCIAVVLSKFFVPVAVLWFIGIGKHEMDTHFFIYVPIPTGILLQ